MLFRIFLISAFCLTIVFYNSQNETNNWYFGNKAALSFSVSPPVAMANSSMTSGEACASISDASGNLLFYSNGVNVWNNSHTIMANGSGILGNASSTQGACILKSPTGNSIYYLFTLDQLGQSNGLRYSIIDMSLSAGQGSVTSKNNLIYTPSCEKIAAVKHCNGHDIWIVTHEFNSANFRSYLLDNSGLGSNPIISNIGPIIANPNASAGYLKASPNGRKLAMVVPGNAAPNGSVVTFDFDNTNGVVSNSLTLFTSEFIYGCEFSPDGTKLYASDFGLNQISQWNLCAGSNNAIVNSIYTVSTGTQATTQAPYALQLAKDGKIYFIHGPTSLLGVLNNPNNIGAAINISLSSISIAPNTSMLGLPTFLNNYNSALTTNSFSFSSNCSIVSFTPSIQPSQTVSSTCSIVNYPTIGYAWNFGDLSSGVANTSTLSNPKHTFTSVGNYSVRLIMTSNCRIDTIVQTVNISVLSPTTVINGPSAICVGEKALLTASGNYTFNWSNGSQTYSMTASPTVNSVYTCTVTSTSNNITCINTLSTNLVVNKCLNINQFESTENQFSVFPNPTSNTVKILNRNFANASIQIRNHISCVVLSTSLYLGINEIDIRQLQPGIYILDISNTDIHRCLKLIIE